MSTTKAKKAKKFNSDVLNDVLIGIEHPEKISTLLREVYGEVNRNILVMYQIKKAFLMIISDDSDDTEFLYEKSIGDGFDSLLYFTEKLVSQSQELHAVCEAFFAAEVERVKAEKVESF